MTDEELLGALHLKTLQVIRPSVEGKELDPVSDPTTIVPYYFNGVYSFDGNTWLTEMTTSGVIKKFPNVDPGKPILILVLGTSLTGRSSFANLLLLKIALITGKEPFLVSVDLPSRDPAACAREMARHFILRLIAARKLDAPAAQPLWDAFKQDDGNPGSPDAPYAALLSTLKTLADPLEGPVVFVLRGGDDDDVWTCCLRASRSLAAYVIAETGDADNARSANDFLKSSQRVALVVANELGLDASVAYLEYRLSAGRPPGAPQVKLAPFVRDAMHALFEDNSDERKVAVTRSIGWLAETLDSALRHAATTWRPKTAAEFPSPPEVITRDFILAIRNDLNSASRGQDV